MAGHQVTEFARRLHVSRAVSGRASEYCRLAEFKCPGGSVSTSCMAVVSLELAASRFGEVFDKKQALKLAGLQAKAYQGWYRTIEKLLGLSCQLGPKELAVRLGCLEAVSLGEEVLRGYGQRMKEKYSAAQREGMDLEEPLYGAAALYCSCKTLKITCDKESFLKSSMSNRTMFHKVLEEMKKCVPDNTDRFKKGAARPPEKVTPSNGAKRSKTPLRRAKMRSLLSRVLSDPTSQEFLQWKKKTIAQAKKELSSSS